MSNVRRNKTKDYINLLGLCITQENFFKATTICLKNKACVAKFYTIKLSSKDKVFILLLYANVLIKYINIMIFLTSKWMKTEANGFAWIGSVLYISYKRKTAISFCSCLGSISLFCNNNTY